MLMTRHADAVSSRSLFGFGKMLIQDIQAFGTVVAAAGK
jgi:hypothetical protein